MSRRQVSTRAAAFRIALSGTVAALAITAGAQAQTAGARAHPSGERAQTAAARTPRAAADGSVQQPTISWTWETVRAPANAPRGSVQFERDCGVCHGNGPARPGTRALRAKYQGKEPALLTERSDLTPEYVKSIVRHGISVMPPFRKTELSDSDLEDIVAYLTRPHRP